MGVALKETKAASLQSKYEKIARLDLAGVSDLQIACVLSVTEQTISAVKELEDYQIIRAKLADQRFTQADLIDRGMDAIEEQATAVVLKTLQHSQDADFALRALMIVNKANRHNRSRQNRPIEAVPGAHTVVYLQQNFINKLNTTGLDVGAVFKKNTLKKVEDFLPVEDAEKLLNVSDAERLELPDFSQDVVAAE